MSKTTKIVAALGIVAGLGVAALPAFTYAETVTGDVEVIVEVQPAIAMTIEGNNDNGELHGDAFNVTEVADPEGNPSQQGWYEAKGTGQDVVYVPTADTTVVAEKTYYEGNGGYRQVNAFAPSSAASSMIDTHSTPAASITGTSSSFIAMLPNSVVNGAWAQSGENNFGSKINVYTNYTGGYTLTLADADDDTDLDREGGSDSIPTGTVEQGETTFDLVAGEAAWGYKIDPQSTSSTGYLPIVGSTGAAATIKTRGTATSGGEETIVTYGVATDDDQATGIYKDTIVYTATAGA